MGSGWSLTKTEDYAARRPGATSASAGPEESDSLTGAFHPTADADDGANRNAFSQDPDLGLAASRPPEEVGVWSSDKEIEHALDGHAYSEISNHPDGRFALNTCRAEDLGQGSCTSRCLVRRRRCDWFEYVCKLDCCSIQCFRT